MTPGSLVVVGAGVGDAIGAGVGEGMGAGVGESTSAAAVRLLMVNEVPANAVLISLIMLPSVALLSMLSTVMVLGAPVIFATTETSPAANLRRRRVGAWVVVVFPDGVPAPEVMLSISIMSVSSPATAAAMPVLRCSPTASLVNPSVSLTCIVKDTVSDTVGEGVVVVVGAAVALSSSGGEGVVVVAGAAVAFVALSSSVVLVSLSAQTAAKHRAKQSKAMPRNILGRVAAKSTTSHSNQK